MNVVHLQKALAFIASGLVEKEKAPQGITESISLQQKPTKRNQYVFGCVPRDGAPWRKHF